MSVLKLPRIWSSDTNYTNGSAAGTPTKADPGAALSAEGFVPGRAGAQHLNYQLNDLSLAGQGTTRLAALRMRLVSPTSFADTGAGIAAISSTTPGRIIVLKGGASDVHALYSDENASIGTVASITSVVAAVARNGSRLVACGTGGNLCCFSTNEGATWSAGSVLPATAFDILYNPVHSRFMAASSSGVSQDVDGASTWATVATGLAATVGGIARVGGTVVVCGQDGGADVDFAVSTDGGVSWSVAGGTVPDANDNSGWVTSDGNQFIYFGEAVGGDELHCCTSADGLTWSQVATLIPAVNVPSRPRIRCCPDTGVLYAWYDQIDSFAVIWSTDGGVTWSSPLYVADRSSNTFAVANGRLISSVAGRLYASDGVQL